MSVEMDDPLDKTTLATISLLESRLLRIEHLLYGTTASPFSSQTQHDAALAKMDGLERRFSRMISQIRVYAELLKIYKSNPDLFHAPPPSQPPSQLDSEAVQSIVLSAASSFPATLSALTAVKDIPIPESSASASLISLTQRMKAIEATQIAQAAEISALRSRSEALVRSWYENGAVVNSQVLAHTEGKIQRVEREVRRRERIIEEEKQEE
ncbi:dynactin subunit p22 domain-containing protein [Trichoderma breve]|uniref:Dynactin subunit p22 domain-containing protein n=1 Tax=Trichoderma breve TaxID=2034170 RepID=A0A9W9B5S5_9HYPO|nr:dynactin subunit p22 domain-containing protein [Trichoderma breve]KAJ4857003.1 dynactin subunit p22 domain-containing protein [Trichoderma breve]